MQNQNIQWFPGHMTKTKRKIQSCLKLIDLVVEIIDARIPISSSNPDLAEIIQNKPKLVLLNKCDKANRSATDSWVSYYNNKGVKAIPVDCKSGRGLNKFVPSVREILAEKFEAQKAKGLKNPILRVMIVGIPNVGKSSFINRISKQTRAKVEDRPGVTRGNQWYTVSKDLEMLDTPGVLWPKFEDEKVGRHLAFIGAIKDNILDIELLAMDFLELMRDHPTEEFLARFKLKAEDIKDLESFEILELVGKKRGMLISGGEINTERAANLIFDEYRDGKFGYITLEYPEDCNELA
ncbi:MAG: ribosome biogenesis GTPase YlqF [Ruminococcus sp.]|nr:ribosome biogenesis GTPase YlqF [Ruminococcus sp.]